MDRKTLCQRDGKLFDNGLGHDIFATLNGDLLASVGKQYGDIVVLLAEDFADADFVDDEYLAALALQLGTPIFQGAGPFVAGFGSKAHDDPR